jgi:hypothetical protein
MERKETTKTGIKIGTGRGIGRGTEVVVEIGVRGTEIEIGTMKPID